MTARLLASAALLSLASGCAKQAPAPDKLALTSVSVTLPDDTEEFPAGAHADLVNANCRACHSASMILTQPPLSVDQWQAEVKKMREVYKAPVADADVPGIVSYLSAMSLRQQSAQTTR